MEHQFAAINPRPQFLGDDDQFGGMKPEAAPPSSIAR
jgi:hypothetical protein